jgi:predicted house-cleaning noncanonical NTP pyrophosphatase (MazG superfamily)
MELTQEHFDKQLEELHQRLDNMATKTELTVIQNEMATKADLHNQTKELENYTDSVASSIIEAVGTGFENLEKSRNNRDAKLEAVEKDVGRLKEAVNLS